MKNKLIICFLIFLVSFIGFSQNDPGKFKKLPDTDTSFKGFLTFGLGRAIPQGYLAWQNVQSDSAGLALNGLDVKLSFGYQFHKQIGVCITYFNQSFGINTNAIANYFSKLYAPSSFSMEVFSGWKLKGLAAGIYGKIALDDKKTIFLEPHALIGLATGQSPSFAITEYINNPSGTTPYFTSRQDKDLSDPVVSYMIGGTLKLELGKKFCLGASVDYLDLLKDTYYSNVLVTYDTNVGPNPPSENYSFRQEMRSLAITASLGFRFGKRFLFQ